jgi:Carboxypeptidase regulatory-like domain
MRFRTLLIAIACFAVAVPPVFAQTTGSISGWVRDANGGPLPGATITVSGPQMPLGRSVTSGPDGAFQFYNLLPGSYHLKAELSGLGAFEQDAVVQVQKDTEVRPTIRATATAEVTVTAATPLVDTKATDISNVTPRETIEKLPLARTFTGTFQLAPGVAENNSSAPNAGGFRQDNTFLYDGVNITNPFFGDLYQDFSELDLQEVNITRGGVTAEYGRTGGFIVNGVTKSGTNNIHAEARFEDQPASFSARSKDPNLTSQFDKFRPGADVSGPLWQDHLFFYGSANILRQTEKDRVNNLGAVPNGDTNINEYFAKLTGNPASNQLIDASFRYRGIDATNADISGTTAPSSGDKPKTLDRVIVGSWFWTVSSKLSLEARFNHNEDNNSVSPNTFMPFQTPFDPARPYLVGSFITGRSSTNGVSYIFPPATGLGQRIGGSDLAQNDQNFFRNEYRLQGSYLANFFGATHDIRAGFTLSNNEEDLIRAADGWGTITISDSSNCGAVAARPCYRARFTPPGSQISKSKTYGAFIQDQMTWNRLTVNLGVLDNEDYYIPNGGGDFSFIRGDFTTPGNSLAIPPCSSAPAGSPACAYNARIDIPWSKQWQPRIGIAYEVDAHTHDKAYINLARYDNMDNQSLARAAAPIRLGRVDDYLNITTGALITEVVRANQNGKLVIPNIDPTYTDELVTGYARPFGEGWSAELWGMYRKTTGIIEDFAVFPATGSSFRYGNIDGFRRYRAVTAEVRKATGAWTMDASYTLSRLDGNWDLEAGGTSLFYSSSYVGDGIGLFPTDPNQQGIELGDRTHIAKLFASYTLPTKTIIGTYARFQSGRPWEARGFDQVNGVALLPLEPKGSRRLSSWTNVDLLVAQNIPLGPANLRLEGRLLNVFNTQPALTVDQTYCNSTPCLSLNVPASNLNPNFGHATSYAPARRVIVSAIVTY